MSSQELLDELKKRSQLLERLEDLERSNSTLRGALSALRKQERDSIRLKGFPVSDSTLSLTASHRILSSVDSTVSLISSASGNGHETSETSADGTKKEEEGNSTKDKEAEMAKRIGALLDACALLVNVNANSRASLASLLVQRQNVVGYLSRLSEKDKQTILSLVQQKFNEEVTSSSSSPSTSSPPPPPGSASAHPEAQSAKESEGLCSVDVHSLSSEWRRLLSVKIPYSISRRPSFMQAAFVSPSQDSPLSSVPVPVNGSDDGGTDGLKQRKSSGSRIMPLDMSAIGSALAGTTRLGTRSSHASSLPSPSPLSPTSPVPPAEESIEYITQALFNNRKLYIDAMLNGLNTSEDKDALCNYGFSLHQLPGYEYEFDEADTEENIIMNETAYNEPEQIKCATLNKLIEKMTEENRQDLNVRYTFLLTYRSFTTPKEFLDKLARRYYIPIPPNLTSAEMKTFIKRRMAPVQIKVLGVLKKWVEDHWTDFEQEDVLDHMKELVRNMQQNTLGPWSKKSLATLLVNIEKLRRGERREVDTPGDFPKPILPAAFGTFPISLLNIKPLEIARQMTLVDFELFKAINSREFLNQSWNKAQKDKLAPGIVGMIHRFNWICLWVQTEILERKNLEQRAEVMVRFLKLMKHLRKFQNYHAAYAIFTALNSNAIHRLRKTWNELPSKQLERFENFAGMFKHDKNNATFRQILAQATSPCIPHIGIFLQDLTFIEDGNPDKLRTMINFQKRRMLAERIMWIKQFQQSLYRIAPVQLIQDYLKLKLSALTEDDLWKKSLAVEPREAPKA